MARQPVMKGTAIRNPRPSSKRRYSPCEGGWMRSDVGRTRRLLLSVGEATRLLHISHLEQRIDSNDVVRLTARLEEPYGRA